MRDIDRARYVIELEKEWSLHSVNPSRSAAIQAAVSQHVVRRILDVGSGAGQEMLPLVRGGEVLGIGVDIAIEAARTAGILYARECPDARVNFVRARMETLPFKDGTFDVVISRLALPYANNRQAVREMARVLVPGGKLLVKLHHARYYGRQLGRAIAGLNLHSALHALRVLASGTIYALSGVQFRGWLVGQEVFQTRAGFVAEACRCGLALQHELPDTNAYTPSLCLKKTV